MWRTPSRRRAFKAGLATVALVTVGFIGTWGVAGVAAGVVAVQMTAGELAAEVRRRPGSPAVKAGIRWAGAMAGLALLVFIALRTGPFGPRWLRLTAFLLAVAVGFVVAVVAVVAVAAHTHRTIQASDKGRSRARDPAPFDAQIPERSGTLCG